MADIIDLKFVTDTTGLDKAVTKSKALEKRIVKLAKEVATGRITSDQYTKAVKKSATELQKLSGLGIRARKSVFDYSASVYQAATASNKAAASTDNYSSSLNQLSTSSIGATSSLGMLSRQAHQTKNKMNANGMAMQQLGYQTGDFIVQVQSGTNAWVAAGQQLTQLTGVLGMMNPAWIGIGAALGIVVPLVTAVGAAFSRSKSSADDLTTTLEGLEEAYSNVASINDTLEVQLVGTWAAAAEGADNYLKKLRDVTQESARAAGEAYLARDAGVLDQFKADLFSDEDSSGIVAKINETIKQLEVGIKAMDTNMFKSPEAESNLEYMKGQINKFQAAKQEFLHLFEKGTTTEESVIRILALREQYERHGSQAMITRIDRIIEELSLQDEISAYRKKLAQDQEDTQKREQDALVRNARIMEAWGKQIAKGQEERDSKKAKALKEQIAAETNLFEVNSKYEKEQDDIRNKKKATLSEIQKKLDQQLWLANSINASNADAEVIALTKAAIARQNFELSLKEKDLNEVQIQDFMEQYDELQGILETNKEITEEKKRQLEVSEKISASLVSMSDAEYQMFLTYQAYGQSRVAGTKAKPPKAPKGPKGKEPTTMEGPIKALERQIELSKALFGLEGDERRRKEVFMQLEFQNRDLLKQYQEDPATLQAIADRVAAQEKVVRVLEEQRQLQESVADAIANNMGDALMSMVDGTMSVKDAFKSMAMEIIKELYRILVVQQLVNAAKASMGGFFEDGGVFQGGSQVQAYADGGVVGSPTTFPMAGGRTGLMGEAGPEAIMPLKRGKDGKLGVQAEGGAGDVIIHQNFNFTANGDESVKKIIAQQAPAIANMTKRQILDDRRRGGQMKQAFG